MLEGGAHASIGSARRTLERRWWRVRPGPSGSICGSSFVEDRALAFYLDRLGFEMRADFPYGGGSRWIEVAPPGAANTISLVPRSEGESAGGDETHCAFATEDIEADHATLRARGVDVDAEIARTGRRRSGLVSVEVSVGDPVPAQFFFRDPDGNRFLIVQPD